MRHVSPLPLKVSVPVAEQFCYVLPFNPFRTEFRSELGRFPLRMGHEHLRERAGGGAGEPQGGDNGRWRLGYCVLRRGGGDHDERGGTGTPSERGSCAPERGV